MPVVYTVGHSTHALEEFIAILDGYRISVLVDIRTVPRSRRNPQYEQAALRESLRQAGIGYIHMPSLGGLRHAHQDSVNTGWKNASFRGYADYMQTQEFSGTVDELVALAGEHTVAIMCAEAVPWRCHRSLVGDALLVRGVEVIDILSETSAKPHKMTPWAHIDGTRITYPAGGKSSENVV
ncbi:MAG TPA: DUF488 domain-containing protein [Bryobacteraceae bacterium]|jgi:uncharacterized protein (DUF488 family)